MINICGQTYCWKITLFKPYYKQRKLAFQRLLMRLWMLLPFTWFAYSHECFINRSKNFLNSSSEIPSITIFNVALVPFSLLWTVPFSREACINIDVLKSCYINILVHEVYHVFGDCFVVWETLWVIYSFLLYKGKSHYSHGCKIQKKVRLYRCIAKKKVHKLFIVHLEPTFVFK